MKKFVLVLLFLSSALFAGEINWLHSYQQGTQVAKEQNRPLLLFFYRPGCPACEYMEENVFTDKSIYSYINTNFVPVSLDISKNDAPKSLKAFGTPTFQFVNDEGTKVRETLVGGKTGSFYLNILKEAVNNYKRTTH